MNLMCKPVKVLVVDDHLQYTKIMAMLLELEWQGCSIAFAASGNEAMDRLAADSFDLVVSDVQMPGMSGYDLLHEIQTHYPGLPVILMSVFAEEGMRQLALEWGAVALLEKPPCEGALTAALQSALQRLEVYSAANSSILA